MIKGLTKNRLIRYGFVSTLITILAILLVVVLNVALTSLFKKYPLRLDLTREKVFELSGDTKEFLAGLDRDVDIFILNSEEGFISSSPAQYFTQANEVVARYGQLSPRIRITYVDLLRNPDFAARYPDVSLQMNDILIVCEGKNRAVASADLFNIQTSYYGSQVLSSKAEQTMTSALLTIAGGEKIPAVVISGHGEENIEAFTGMLRLNAYEIGGVNLVTETIPPDVSLAILAAPAWDLGEEELRKLDAFLAGGDHKTLFYLASASQPPLPVLESFLEEWGVDVEEGTAFENNSSRLLSNSPFISFADYAEETYSKKAAEKGLVPVVAQSRPLKAVFEQSRHKTTVPLLKLSPDSGIRPADTGTDWQPSPADITGNVPVMILCRSQQTGLSGSLEQTNVLVAGSILSVNQTLLGSPAIANSGYFLDLLGVLADRERTVWIADKSLGSAQLGITNMGQVIILALVFMGLLPLGVLIAGIVVWLRRRHR